MVKVYPVASALNLQVPKQVVSCSYIPVSFQRTRSNSPGEEKPMETSPGPAMTEVCDKLQEEQREADNEDKADQEQEMQETPTGQTPCTLLSQRLAVCLQWSFCFKTTRGTT